MNFVNDKVVKVVPVALGNAESNKPAVFYISKLSGVGMNRYAQTLREKEIKTDSELFCLIVEKIENCFLEDPESGEIKELTTPEDVIEIPGISPLLEEVITKFSEVNMFGGVQKNAPKPSSV